MAFVDELEKQGQWLFRWRSYLPIIIVPIFLWSLQSPEQLEHIAGDTIEDIYEIICIIISFIGLGIRCITVAFVPKGTSGRNTKTQKATRLNTTGIYSITRNPLYLGNFFIILGIVMFTQSLWAILIVTLLFWIYYERIIFAEEQFLKKKFGVAFLQWAKDTPIFFPKLKNYQSPDLPFSIKNILKREYTGFFVIITAFTIIDLLEDYFDKGYFQIEMEWKIIFIFGLLSYLLLRYLKKNTNLLKEEGR